MNNDAGCNGGIAEKSYKPLLSGRESLVEWITWILRIAVGCVFIFSGFVKAIDPWGTIFKVDDYLSAMSLTVWPNLRLVGVFALCSLEFLTGVFILSGCFRKSMPVVAAAIMAFMLPFSLWIAIKNPVSDCGCFGDALLLSNWATFWKNVALSGGVAWLILFNRRCLCLVTPALQWMAFVTSGVFIVIIELLGYNAQPLIDFRPYRIGETILGESELPDDSPRFRFIYEKDGERRVFSEDDTLPDEDSGWKFVDREEIPSEESPVEDKPAPDKNLRVWSQDGLDDETEDAIQTEGEELIVMMPDLAMVSPATTWKLNSLYEWAEKHDVRMIGIAAGTASQIADWEDLSMASYPIYTADDTQIKEVVRGNPAVVFLKDGVIEWKSTLAAIDIDDFAAPGTTEDARHFASDGRRVLNNLTYLYLAVMAVLILLSFTPRLRFHYLPRRKEVAEEKNPATHDDTAHHEE